MINTIVFDIGNVLVPFNWQEVYADLFDEQTAKIIGRATVLDIDTWNEFDRGTLSNEEIFEGFYNHEPNYKEQIDLAVWEVYKRMKPFTYAQKWLKKLKEQGYKIYLLSNFGKTPFELAKEGFDFLQYCDGSVISYEVEKIKPDPLIYATLCQKYRISPCDAVFIDDNIANVKAANDYGFNTVHFTDYENAKKALKNLGVK